MNGLSLCAGRDRGAQTALPSRGKVSAKPCGASYIPSSARREGREVLCARGLQTLSSSNENAPQIPEKPVGVVEGTSYTIVIVAALGFAAAAGWAILKDLFVTPAECAAQTQNPKTLNPKP